MNFYHIGNAQWKHSSDIYGPTYMIFLFENVKFSFSELKTS